MIVSHRAGEVRALLDVERRVGRRIGFVPTMGALHEGHLALIRAAAAACDVVVVSIFVNPAQFTDASDLAAYPRQQERDAEAARSAGADVVYAPDAAEMYPEGFATAVRVGGVSERWEGAHRGAAHFDGVALVVTKLLLTVGPDVAFFGAKDAQQVAVVRRLVADLQIPTTIEARPTVRDADGLALSSRNARLAADDRAAALSLSRSLREVGERVAAGETDVDALTAIGARLVADAGAVVDYWAIVDATTFEPLTRVPSAGALAIVAASVGDVRLIDNAVLAPQK